MLRSFTTNAFSDKYVCTACLLQATLLADVYNSSRLGWEPVLESWRFRLGAHTSQSPAVASAALSVSAEHMLELTASLAASDAVAAAASIARGVAEVWKAPTQLESVLRAAEPLSGGHSPFWLQNETGVGVTFWLREPKSLAADPAGRL